MGQTKPKVMVVDDDPAMLFTVTEILEDAGYEVCGVKNGYEAIEMASQESFALVFMDISLPGIDGVEAFRRIKSVSPGTPVIMMTGHSVEQLISQALEEGAYTVLYKPLDIASLLIAARDVLNTPGVLVVDVDPDIIEPVKDIFEHVGYQVALATDGNQAISQAESKRGDVILMDIGMPGMDGSRSLSTERRIRSVVQSRFCNWARSEPGRPTGFGSRGVLDVEQTGRTGRYDRFGRLSSRLHRR